MPSLSHSSYLSTADEKGFRQWLSIDALSSTKKKDSGTVLYKAKAISTGRFSDEKHHQIMLLKFLHKPRSTNESHAFAKETLELNKLVQALAAKFNNTLSHIINAMGEKIILETVRITFQPLQMAQLESVSFFDKTRREGEYFVFGRAVSKCFTFLDSERTKSKETKEFLQKKSQQRSSSVRGHRKPKLSERMRTLSLQEDGKGACDCPREGDKMPHNCILHAFVHHFFAYNGGRVAVDCLRGDHDEETGYTLITPNVHSLSDPLGPNDCGEEGIRRVIENHRCNHYCKHLPDMKSTLDEVLLIDSQPEETTTEPFHNGTWHRDQRFPIPVS